jgi:hypothetical protein
MSKIKTFRGLIASGEQDRVPLHTIDGSTGYRITKFQIFPGNPGSDHYEATLKIYKTSQTTVDNDVDFSDQRLLAAAYYQDDNAKHYASSDDIIFDGEKFNQDIYVTYIGTDGATAAMNYYIELEQMKLDLNENTVATLKDIRNVA